MLEKETRLDPRVKRTRHLLQAALAALLAEKDFQSITVQDIAARAEVNRATFYAHFDDKYALLNYSVRESLQEMLGSKLTGTPAFTLNNLRVLAMTVCEFLAQFSGHCLPFSRNNDQMLVAAQVQNHIYELLVAWIKQAQRSEALYPAPPENAAMAASWVIFGSAFQWVRGGRKLAPEQLADQVLSLLLSGLGAYLVEAVSR